MSAAWRLAINTLSQRRSRTALLVASVSLCAALIAAISCAMASLQEAVRDRIAETVGVADVRVQKLGGGAFEASILTTIDAWPEVAKAVGRGKESVALRNPKTGDTAVTVATGILPDREAGLKPPKVTEGRFLQSTGEIVLQKPLNVQLKASVGDEITVDKFGDEVRLTVVGVEDAPPLSAVFDETACTVVLEDLARMTDRAPRLTEVDIQIKPGVEAEAMTKARRGDLPEGMLLQSTAKITSGLDKNMRSNQLGLLLASVLTFLAAAFIITTGLMTNVTERTREMAVLRCIGAFKRQLAGSQLLVGLAVGGLGAIIGVPMGVAGAAALVLMFPQQLPGGFAMSWLGVSLALIGAVAAGLIGAIWPAIAASRVSPLEGLAVRSVSARPRWIWACLGVGLACLGMHVASLTLPPDADLAFWLYVIVGLPALLTGWFLIAVPVTFVLGRALSEPVSAALGLPRRMLAGTLGATPYRHGFTAGAMMLGLSMMVAIWTNGRAVMVDWLDALEIPDAFVAGVNMKPETQRAIERVEGVSATCAVTVQSVSFSTTRDGEKVSDFGIAGLGKYKTNFIAFEPETFFDMTNITWVQGDPKTAVPKLKAGGAILVAREFYNAHRIGVGDVLDLKFEDKVFPFEVVGVVTSPGLDIVSKFYDVGEGYVDQALNAVFGPRKDLIAKFKNDTINLIQIGFKPGLPADAKAKALEEVRTLRGTGILQAGSSMQIKAKIGEFIGGSLFIASIVAIGAMFVACFAVANLVVAGVQARQFEFGVLRSLGAQRGLLGRLVLAEALIIGLAACLLGSAMGVQAAWGGQKMYQLVIGLVLTVKPPIMPMLLGCVAVLAITLLAAWPTARGLAKRQPRELLAAVKG
jgi:putative ABC transport system permease protein